MKHTLKIICICYVLVSITACDTKSIQEETNSAKSYRYNSLFEKLPQEKKDLPLIWEVLQGYDGNPPWLAAKKADISHPRYKQFIQDIYHPSASTAHLVKKYKNATSVPLEEIYTDAALIAQRYKAYVDNRDWIFIEDDMCRVSYQNVHNTIYPKMKEMYPELAKINADYYLQTKQEAQASEGSDNLDLEHIKNIAIVEYAARTWWNDQKDYLLIAYQNFFQESPEQNADSE